MYTSSRTNSWLNQKISSLLVILIVVVKRILLHSSKRGEKQQLTSLCDIELKTWALGLDLDSKKKRKKNMGHWTEVKFVTFNPFPTPNNTKKTYSNFLVLMF